MAYEIPGYKLTRVAAEDTAQYVFVKLDAAGEAENAEAESDTVVGVCQAAVLSGRAAEIAVDGITKLSAGEAIAIGDYVTTDGAGQGAVAATTERAFGIALQAADNADEIIAVLLLTPGFILVP